MKTILSMSVLVAAVGLAPVAQNQNQNDLLRSRAERTNFEETSRDADLAAFLAALAKSSPLVRVQTFGTSEQGRTMSLVTLSNPAVARPADLRAGRPVVFIMANIHGGEVEGKEAVQVLMRRLTAGDLRPLLDRMAVVIVPNYNVDGNEAIDVENRTAQYGPIAGVGKRENAKGLDLNRDYMKLESAEARALVAAFTAWDPHLVVDLHTTNGSYHGYHLTQSIPLNLSLSPKTLDYHRETMMPAIMKSLGERHKTRSYLLRQLRTWQSGARRATPVDRFRSPASCRSELRRLPQPPDDPLRGVLVSVVQAADQRHRVLRRGDLAIRRRPSHRGRGADEITRCGLDHQGSRIRRDAARG